MTLPDGIFNSFCVLSVLDCRICCIRRLGGCLSRFGCDAASSVTSREAWSRPRSPADTLRFLLCNLSCVNYFRLNALLF